MINCPNCGEPLEGFPALSRRDNKTEICSDCGTLEAMEDFLNIGSIKVVNMSNKYLEEPGKAKRLPGSKPEDVDAIRTARCVLMQVGESPKLCWVDTKNPLNEIGDLIHAFSVARAPCRFTDTYIRNGKHFDLWVDDMGYPLKKSINREASFLMDSMQIVQYDMHNEEECQHPRIAGDVVLTFGNDIQADEDDVIDDFPEQAFELIRQIVNIDPVTEISLELTKDKLKSACHNLRRVLEAELDG